MEGPTPKQEMPYSSFPEPAETTPRELIYSQSFKEVVRGHPGMLASFGSLIGRMNEERESGRLKYGDELEEGDVRLRILGPTGGAGGSEGMQVERCKYFRAQVGDEFFFVKCIPGLAGGMGLGAEEFKSLEEVAELLKGIEGAAVIDFQLGYQDKDKTYFVSRWTDAVRLLDRLAALNSSGDEASLREKGDLMKRFNAINAIMEAHSFLDFDYNNVLYDPLTDKLIVFDVHKNAA